MNTRDKYNKLVLSLSDIQEEQNNLRAKECDIIDASNELIKSIIKEENLLQLTEWEFCFRNNIINGIYLSSKTYPSDSKINPLRKLTWNGWHSNFILEKGISLSFNDEEMTLEFNAPEKIISFISEYSLVVDTGFVVAKQNLLKEQLAVLESYRIS